MIYDLFQAIMNDISDIMNDEKGNNIMNDLEQLCIRRLTCYEPTCSVSKVHLRASFVSEASFSLSRWGVSAMQQADANVSARRLKSTGSCREFPRSSF